LPTGARAALQGTLASSAADQMSKEQLGITEANYATGRQNWKEATAGLSALANQYDPTAFSSGAQKGYSSAFGMADQIQQEKNQEQTTIASGITSLAMDAATFGAGGMTGLVGTGGEGVGGKLGDFFKGGGGAESTLSETNNGYQIWSRSATGVTSPSRVHFKKFVRVQLGKKHRRRLLSPRCIGAVMSEVQTRNRFKNRKQDDVNPVASQQDTEST